MVRFQNVKPHLHYCIKFQITRTSDRYQLASPNTTHLLATIKSLTKTNLQGLGGFQSQNYSRKIAYSRSASEILFLHK